MTNTFERWDIKPDGLNNPLFLLVMTANNSTPEDIKIKEIIEYLDKMKQEAEE